MRHSPTRSLLAASAAAALFALLAAPAAAAPGPGTRAVREANETIRNLLRKQAAPGSARESALAARVTEEVRGFLDVAELGRRALRDHWEGLSAEQRRKFQKLLRGLIEKNYVKGLRKNLEYEVEYTGEEERGEELVVHTEINSRRHGRPYTIDVDYVLRRTGGGWRAYDVVTDGVGLVENYRAMFNKIIAKDGFDGLLERMRKKRRELGS